MRLDEAGPERVVVTFNTKRAADPLNVKIGTPESVSRYVLGPDVPTFDSWSDIKKFMGPCLSAVKGKKFSSNSPQARVLSLFDNSSGLDSSHYHFRLLSNNHKYLIIQHSDRPYEGSSLVHLTRPFLNGTFTAVRNPDTMELLKRANSLEEFYEILKGDPDVYSNYFKKNVKLSKIQGFDSMGLYPLHGAPDGGYIIQVLK